MLWPGPRKRRMAHSKVQTASGAGRRVVEKPGCSGLKLPPSRRGMRGGGRPGRNRPRRPSTMLHIWQGQLGESLTRPQESEKI